METIFQDSRTVFFSSLVAARWFVYGSYNYSLSQTITKTSSSMESAARTCYNESMNNTGRIAELRSGELFKQMEMLMRIHCVTYASVAPTAW